MIAAIWTACKEFIRAVSQDLVIFLPQRWPCSSPPKAWVCPPLPTPHCRDQHNVHQPCVSHVPSGTVLTTRPPERGQRVPQGLELTTTMENALGYPLRAHTSSESAIFLSTKAHFMFFIAHKWEGQDGTHSFQSPCIFSCWLISSDSCQVLPLEGGLIWLVTHRIQTAGGLIACGARGCHSLPFLPHNL